MRFMMICALVVAAGCGGGASTMMGTAQLAGVVYEVDGQSALLGGVQVTIKETGERAWTDASGTFAFTGLSAGRYTLAFDTTLMAASLQEGDGAEEGGVDDAAEENDGQVEDSDADENLEDEDSDDGEDEFEDEEGDPKVDVPEGGSVEVDVALEDGKVKDFASDHGDGQYAMARLHLTDAAEIAGYRVGGGIKIAKRGDGTLFKVCVEGLQGGDVIEVFLGDPGTSIGTAKADGDGRACLVLENSIPLGAPNLGELAGMLVQVFLSGSDLRLLVGEVPSLHQESDGEHEGDENDDGDKPDENGTEDKDEGSDGDEAAGSDEPGEEGTDGEGDGAESGSSEESDGEAI